VVLTWADRSIPTSGNDFFAAKVNESCAAENQTRSCFLLPADDEVADGSSCDAGAQKVLSANANVDTLRLYDTKKFRCIPIPYLYLVLCGIMHNFRTLV